MEKALKDFETAYDNLVYIWESDILVNKDYPFNTSFDEIPIGKWVASTLFEIKQKKNKIIKEVLLEDRREKVILILDLGLRKPIDLIYFSEEDLDNLLKQQIQE